MYQEISIYIIAVLALFTVQFVSSEDRALLDDVSKDNSRFAINDMSNGVSDGLPYTKQYWFYPHTSHSFLKTLLRYLALNEQSYRNTVKRQRNFGFMGSRGKRTQETKGSDILRKLHQDAYRRRYGQLLENSELNRQNDGGFLQIKRQPHLGFHGMRG